MYVAPDGPTGVSLAAQCRPDLVLLDISMPGMTGWQVARELRAMAGAGRMKIIFVSANAHENIPSNVSSADGERVYDAFVMKPVDVHTLLDRMSELLGIDWEYEPEKIDVAAVPLSDAEGGDPTLPAGARHHLDDLYRLGRIGHVRGIHAKLAEMAAEHPANEAVASHLRALVSNFELKRYMTVLEAMRKNG